jgi:hypothetical protein
MLVCLFLLLLSFQPCKVVVVYFKQMDTNGVCTNINAIANVTLPRITDFVSKRQHGECTN